MTLHVVWFKRDLRVQDHAPLTAAVEAAQAAHGAVLPLYVVEPELWQQPDASCRHWSFIHDSLHSLHAALAERGAPLVVRVGGMVAVLEALRQAYGKFTLWSHEETGNGWSYARDKAVAAWCQAQGVVWHEYPAHGVVRRLASRDGWAALRDARMQAPCVPPPAHIPPLQAVVSDAIPAKEAPLFGAAVGAVQTGGRAAAERVLSSFLAERGRRYMTTISKPGVSARHCSRLSPHIAFGTLSVREVEQATQAQLRHLRGLADPEASAFAGHLSAFLSRLAWRCHFVQKLEQQPEIEFRCMHPAFEGMREPHFREDFFTAWKTGNTGYPLVDACMRSLHENGWITFRMRAMLVSFASYHLWLDWRQTAPFLAQLFTDYEPGIHYAQFQMQSGVTGINAVRMYNPLKQSLDHDPEGKFIRRFVPELRAVPAAFIHEPWRMDAPPPGYPPPIVEHEAAIKRAREALRERWQQEDFKAQAQAVNQKLGSRQRSPSARRKQASSRAKQGGKAGGRNRNSSTQLAFEW